MRLFKQLCYCLRSLWLLAQSAQLAQSYALQRFLYMDLLPSHCNCAVTGHGKEQLRAQPPPAHDDGELLTHSCVAGGGRVTRTGARWTRMHGAAYVRVCVCARGGGCLCWWYKSLCYSCAVVQFRRLASTLLKVLFDCVLLNACEWGISFFCLPLLLLPPSSSLKVLLVHLAQQIPVSF